MANFRFEIGQKVVIHGNTRHPHCNGHVSTVVDRLFYESATIRTTGELLTNANIYLLEDIPPPLEGALEENLAPYDPPGSWEDCAWQPKEVEA